MPAELDQLERELADFEKEQRGGGGPGKFRLLPVAVAIAVVLGFGGILWYVYSQGVRSGSEDTAPLIQSEGPAKIKPEDPGGLVVPHQDKEVYGVIDGSAENTDEKLEVLLPPPEDPMQPPVQEEQVVVDSVAVPETAEAPEIPSITEPAEEPPLPEPALAEPDEPPTVETVETAETVVEPAPEPEPEVAAVEPAPEPEPAVSTDPNGWKVQIAAVKSEDAARSEWLRQQKKIPDLLGNLTLSIQETTVNGTKYFRIRGGTLPNKAAAEKLCDQLKAQKLGCLIVKPGG
jgi:cell division septation protein DedD